MTILNDEALQLLEAAGCRLENERIVKIPDELVLEALQSAPRNISVCNRNGQAGMDLGGRRAYFGTGSDLIFSLDAQSMQRHPCRLDDIRRAALVSDALENIDFIMSFAHPSDVAPKYAYLLSFQMMSATSAKPIVCTAQGRDDLAVIWEIGCMLRGGEAALAKQPYLVHYAEPISPLKHPQDSLDKLLFCAEKSIPVIYSPAPIAGSTAPMTIAGHVAQGLAESFCGLVIHQLKNRGAPFLMGTGPAVLDMVTGTCSYNAPEYLMAYMAIVEMSHYYDLPSWGYAGTSDSQLPDEQASFEAGLLTFMTTFAGANLNHDVGYLDFGRTGSLEMIVMLDDFISQIRRMNQGIAVDDEMLAVDVIREVGANGNFFTHPHSLKHLRRTQWRPTLVNRLGYEEWQAAGSSRLVDRAHERVQDILKTHKPISVSPQSAQIIQERVNQFML
jgi:trimethylamine--corrinoid protein Co-methyltransferase